MPVSEALYKKALEIKSTLYPRLRTVTISDTLMPDDYNVPYEIVASLLGAVGEYSGIPYRYIRMGDDVYAEHVSDLKTACYKLWTYIDQKLLEPYIRDPDFYPLKSLLDSMRIPKHGDELRTDEWNAISDYCRRMVDLILRCVAGFSESWDDWSHINENWIIVDDGYLDTSEYVSKPSSLTFTTEYATTTNCALKNSNFINVPYIQIETWAKMRRDWGKTGEYGIPGGALGFCFRTSTNDVRYYEYYRMPTGWTYWLYFLNSPYVIFFDTYQIKCKAYLCESSESTPTLIGERSLVDKPEHADEWNKYRATLSKYNDGINIKLEYWDGSLWRIMGTFYHDSNIFWGGDYYHGISLTSLYTRYFVVYKTGAWIDDTVITKL